MRNNETKTQRAKKSKQGGAKIPRPEIQKKKKKERGGVAGETEPNPGGLFKKKNIEAVKSAEAERGHLEETGRNARTTSPRLRGKRCKSVGTSSTGGGV